MKAVHHPGLTGHFDAWLQGPDDAPFPALTRGLFDITTEPGGQRRFWFVCPGKCGTLAPIALRPVVDGSDQSWDFDGDMAAPTLSPSIDHRGCWHGWLRSGVFTEC